MCIPLQGLKSLLNSMNNLFRGIPFSLEGKIHEDNGEQREILLVGFTPFCRFSSTFREWLSAENLPFLQEGKAN